MFSTIMYHATLENSVNKLNTIHNDSISLPEDVLAHIFSYLDAKNFATISRVCCEWLELRKNDVAWEGCCKSINYQAQPYQRSWLKRATIIKNMIQNTPVASYIFQKPQAGIVWDIIRNETMVEIQKPINDDVLYEIYNWTTDTTHSIKLNEKPVCHTLYQSEWVMIDDSRLISIYDVEQGQKIDSFKIEAIQGVSEKIICNSKEIVVVTKETDIMHNFHKKIHFWNRQKHYVNTLSLDNKSLVQDCTDSHIFFTLGSGSIAYKALNRNDNSIKDIGHGTLKVIDKKIATVSFESLKVWQENDNMLDLILDAKLDKYYSYGKKVVTIYKDLVLFTHKNEDKDEQQIQVWSIHFKRRLINIKINTLFECTKISNLYMNDSTIYIRYQKEDGLFRNGSCFDEIHDLSGDFKIARKPIASGNMLNLKIKHTIGKTIERIFLILVDTLITPFFLKS